MANYGVTADGFRAKTFEEILAEMKASALAEIDPTLDLSDDEPLGQLLAIFAARQAELWKLAEGAYHANNRNRASGPMLDNIGGIFSCPLRASGYSRVILSCTLDAGATLTAGVAKANVTGAPTDLWTPVADYTAPYTGTFDVLFRATTRGARTADAGTINVITAPVTGWTAVVNALDADVARDEETDAAYRARQVQELALAGSSTVASMTAALLQLEGMIEVKVFENTGATTNAADLPPHSIQAVVWDGVSEAVDNDVIAQALWNNRGGAIGFFGAVDSSPYGTAIDADGPHMVKFLRAAPWPVWLDVTLETDPATFPVDGVAQVKDAIIAAGRARLRLGVDVLAIPLSAAALNVPGVIDVTDFRLGFEPDPTGTSNLTLTSRQIAVLDTSRIEVTVV